MFGRRREVPPDDAVHAAEEIVRRAWVEELLRRKDHLDVALQTAFGYCDVAHQRLAAAQRGGDPRKIGAARARAQRAVDTTRECTVASAEVRLALRAQLNPLTGRLRKRPHTPVEPLAPADTRSQPSTVRLVPHWLRYLGIGHVTSPGLPGNGPR